MGSSFAKVRIRVPPLQKEEIMDLVDVIHFSFANPGNF